METEQDRRKLRKAKNRPKTDDELWEWLRDVLGLRYARTVTKDGHRAPFEFLSDIYFEREDKALVRANRGGGKTVSLIAIYLLNVIFKPGSDIVHIGGTEVQARQGYAYFAGDPTKEGFTGFIRRPAFSDLLASEPMVSKTALKNGSRLEIRTGGSAKSVSGPHPNLLGIDELDHIQMTTLDTALQMPISKGMYGAQTIMGSSQYAYYGALQTMLDQAPERGIAVYEYDIFDVMQGCEHSYPKQCQDCPFYLWINPFSGAEEELCKGRGAKADGHYPYSDATDKILMTTDMEMFALQMLLLRGTSMGMVYSAFNKDVHVKQFPPEGVDISKWKAFAGIDLRWKGRIEVMVEAPEVLPNGRRARWIIAEWADDGSTPSMIRSAAAELRRNVREQFGLNIEVFWMEHSAADEAADWQTIGLNGKIVPPDGRNIAYRIGQVRDAFRDAQGNVSLWVDPSCKDLITSVGKGYHCKKHQDGTFDRGKPDMPFSHSPNALEYAYMGGPAPRPARFPDTETQAGWWEGISGKGGKWAPY